MIPSVDFSLFLSTIKETHFSKFPKIRLKKASKLKSYIDNSNLKIDLIYLKQLILFYLH